jgi:hypothetical protein
LQEAADFAVHMEHEQPFVKLEAPVYRPAPVEPDNQALCGGEHSTFHCAPEVLTRLALKWVNRTYCLQFIYDQRNYLEVRLECFSCTFSWLDAGLRLAYR